MSPKKFASFMVRDDIGQSRTMVRLTPGERWAFVAGVLALASKSPVRGFLLVAMGEPVTVNDIKAQAAVTKAVAESAVDKLIRLHVLEHDDNLGCLAIVNWSTYQVEPKVDATAAARKRRQRDRERDVTRDMERDQNGSDTSVTPVTSFARTIARREGEVK